MSERLLKLGVAGLGRAFMVMVPGFAADKRVALTAAADPRPEAQRQFEAEFHGRAYPTVEELCDDREIDAIYIATPHQFHRANVLAAASARQARPAGKTDGADAGGMPGHDRRVRAGRRAAHCRA